MIPFAPIKAAIGELCAAWKSACSSRHATHGSRFVRDADELESGCVASATVLPRGDAMLLPIDNISVEALAAHFAELLRDRLGAHALPTRSRSRSRSTRPGPRREAARWRCVIR